MGEHYRVVYSGQLRLDADKQETARLFGERFKVSEEKARKVLSASSELILKRDLDLAKAEKYRRALESIGMIVRLEPMRTSPAAGGLSLEPMAAEPNTTESEAATQILATAPLKPACPKCGSRHLAGDNCLDCGIVIPKYLARQHIDIAQGTGGDSGAKADPYAAPQAGLVEARGPGEMSGPGSRPFASGWRWLRRGFWHFRQNPLAWIVSIVLWLVISMALSLVPFVGSLAVALFTPVILAGFLLGSAAQEHGESFEIGHLFAGFSSSVGQLVLVGLLYLLGIIAILVAAFVVGGGAVIGMLGGLDALANPDPVMISSVMGSGTFLLIALVMTGLSILLMMTYWFAPALIAMEGLSALTAMKMSFRGCVKNVLPFLLYGILGLLLLFLATIPVGLGLLIVLPMLTASLYTAYRDIYYQ